MGSGFWGWEGGGGGGWTDLQRKEADAAGALDQDRLAGLEGLEAVEGVPARDGGAGERGGLDVGEVVGGFDEAVLVERAVLAEGAVKHTAQAGLARGLGHGAELVALVEEGGDAASLLPAGDLGPDGDDLAGAVGGGDDGEVQGEGVHSLGSVSHMLSADWMGRHALGMMRSR